MAVRFYVDRDGIAWIRISRPERRNAWSSEVSVSLLEHISKIPGDPVVIGVIITGDGDYFSSGVDLREILDVDGRDKIYGIFEKARRAFEAIALLEKPVVAAVNGPAYGISVELLHIVDYVIASRRASFAITGARLGLVPPLSPTIGWRNIGVRRACYLAISGSTISPDSALMIGLVDEVVDHEMLEERARGVVKEISASDPQAIAAIKRAVYHERIRGIEEGFRLIAESALRSETRERIRGFLAKRHS